MEMCRWIGSHFHDWIDYNGVAFSIELLEWGRTFSDFFSSAAADPKVSPNWSLETMTCHSSHCFSIVWG